MDWKETARELLTAFSLLAIIGTATVFLMVQLLNLIFGWFGVHRRPRGTRKLGRNDPCRCGSGQKYKRCCLPADRQSGLSQTWSASNRDPEVFGVASAAARGFGRWASLPRFTMFGRLKKRR
jgi:hypothetical protein